MTICFEIYWNLQLTMSHFPLDHRDVAIGIKTIVNNYVLKAVPSCPYYPLLKPKKVVKRKADVAQLSPCLDCAIWHLGNARNNESDAPLSQPVLPPLHHISSRFRLHGSAIRNLNNPTIFYPWQRSQHFLLREPCFCLASSRPTPTRALNKWIPQFVLPAERCLRGFGRIRPTAAKPWPRPTRVTRVFAQKRSGRAAPPGGNGSGEGTRFGAVG